VHAFCYRRTPPCRPTLESRLAKRGSFRNRNCNSTTSRHRHASTLSSQQQARVRRSVTNPRQAPGDRLTGFTRPPAASIAPRSVELRRRGRLCHSGMQSRPHAVRHIGYLGTVSTTRSCVILVQPPLVFLAFHCSPSSFNVDVESENVTTPRSTSRVYR